MDIQVILLIVIFLLTVNIVAVGVYLVLVLKEFRETLHKVNGILDTTETVFSTVSSPLMGISSALGAFSSVFKVIKSLKENNSEDQ